jgi:hypothetical protein
MFNLRSNFARASAAALAALFALFLALYIPSILYNINPCLISNNCLSPFQLDVLFQKITNATNGNIANTLAVVQEIQAEVPACPGGYPRRPGKGDHGIDDAWMRDPDVIASKIDCTKCCCSAGCCRPVPYCLSPMKCITCCMNGTSKHRGE